MLCVEGGGGGGGGGGMEEIKCEQSEAIASQKYKS